MGRSPKRVTSPTHDRPLPVRVLLFVDRVLLWVGVLGVAAMVVILFVNTVARYFLSGSIEGSHEIIEAMLLPLVAFLVTGWAYRQGAHVRVDTIVGRLPEKARLVLRWVEALMSVAVCAFLVYCVAINMFDTYQVDDRTLGVLALPVWIGHAFVLVGLASLGANMFLEAIWPSRSSVDDTGISAGSDPALLQSEK